MGPLIWRDFDTSDPRQEAADGRTVLVAFTASWCATSMAQDRIFESRDVRQLMAEWDVLPIRGDFTRPQRSIMRWIQAFDEPSVPLYVIVPAGRPDHAIKLPSVLAADDVRGGLCAVEEREGRCGGAPHPRAPPRPTPVAVPVVADRVGPLVWRDFDTSDPRQAAADGRTVLVAFTAEWCATSKVQDHIFDSPSVRELIAELDVLPIRGDNTTRKASIMSWLEEFDEPEVPLYVILPAGRPDDAIKLPTVLTEDDVRRGLCEAEERASRCEGASPRRDSPRGAP